MYVRLTEDVPVEGMITYLRYSFGSHEAGFLAGSVTFLLLELLITGLWHWKRSLGQTVVLYYYYLMVQPSKRLLLSYLSNQTCGHQTLCLSILILMSLVSIIANGIVTLVLVGGVVARLPGVIEMFVRLRRECPLVVMILMAMMSVIAHCVPIAGKVESSIDQELFRLVLLVNRLLPGEIAAQARVVPVLPRHD